MKSAEKLISVYGLSEVFPQDSKAFTELHWQDAAEFSAQKPDAEQLVSISVNVEITRSDCFYTSAGSSCEGRVLTGKKLIVEGKINQKIEYVAAAENQPVYVADLSAPFSTWIGLNPDCQAHQDFEVTAYVEDISARLLDKRRIFRNLLFLVNAMPVNN